MRVFLTGGRGGIGSAITEQLAENGIDTIAPSSSELDLSSDFDCSAYPEVDGFIHCAGINILARHENINASEFSRLFKINTLSFVSLCSQLKIKKGGSIVGIGSLYATTTKEERIQYTMSKHALHGAVKTIAIEKAKEQIKVNMISPGFVDTAMTRRNNTEQRIADLNSMIPLGMVNSQQIASMCVYLITKNTSITGQNFIIDGGYSLRGL
jgi:3-oxoacyl-[acyl-carrier protein] reductase